MESWKIRQTVDLSCSGIGTRVWPDVLMVEGDNEAHTWEITILNDGKPVNLNGVTCEVHFLRDRNGVSEDVLCAGSCEGNIARVTLKSQCYVEGNAVGVFRITMDEKILTLSRLVFSISKGPGGVIV